MLVRAIIDEAAFRAIVAGHPAKVPGRVQDASGAAVEVEFILSDIGWERMRIAINAAEGRL